MDPRKQECFAQYLYGAGFFSRDDNTLAMLTGKGSAQAHFCSTCPVRVECEQRQRQRVRADAPEQAEEFARTVKEASAQGFSFLLTELATAQRGVNPFYNDAMENFKRGHAARGRTMTQSETDVR